MAETSQPLSAKVAEFLEMIATRIRELSVDRAATAITWIAVGLLLATAAMVGVFWLLVGIFRALGTLLGTEVAYAVVGLILVIAGAVVWWRRYPQDRSPQE